MIFVSKKRSMMSDKLKIEIAKELGFYDTVLKDGWASIKSRDAGNMVKRAIEKANETTEHQK